MYEDFILFDVDLEESFDDIPESVENDEVLEIDYQKIEEALYNALKQNQKDIDDKEALKKSVEVEQTDFVEFSSSTDARMLTGSVEAAPTSSAQQTTVYLLDIRNVLIIFLFIYFIINVYSKIKNAFINYYGGKE